MFHREHGKVIPFPSRMTLTFVVSYWWWDAARRWTDWLWGRVGFAPLSDKRRVSRFHRQRPFITVASSLWDGLTGEGVHCDSVSMRMATSAMTLTHQTLGEFSQDELLLLFGYQSVSSHSERLCRTYWCSHRTSGPASLGHRAGRFLEASSPQGQLAGGVTVIT